MSDQYPDLPPHVREFLDTMRAAPPLEYCRRCGSKMLLVETTFFSHGEQFWTVPIPVLPRCDLKKDTANFISPDVC